jgi:hypothetical protein
MLLAGVILATAALIAAVAAVETLLRRWQAEIDRRAREGTARGFPIQPLDPRQQKP